MKILVTGMTATQIGSQRQRPINKYVSAPALLVKGLRALRHDVDWRPASPFENFKEYDRVVVFMANPVMLGAMYRLGAFTALVKRPDAIVSFDDWQFKTIMNGIGTLSTRDYYYLWQSTIAVQRRHNEEVLASPRLRRRIEKFVTDTAATRTYRHRVLCYVFPWGDVDKLGVRSEIGIDAVDPSPLVEIPSEAKSFVPPTSRHGRRWLLATLGDHSRWLNDLNLRWPVDWYGHKKGTHPRIAESELVATMSKYEGLLSPKYPHAGGGWWRARFVFAAVRGVPLLGDAAEMAPIGPAYDVAPRDFERLSIADRADVAYGQRETFQRRSWSRRKFLNQLRRIING